MWKITTLFVYLTLTSAILAFVPSCSSSQLNESGNSDIILWSKHKPLKWSDFKGVEVLDSNTEAVIKVDIKVKVIQKKKITGFRVEAVFYKSLSTVRSGASHKTLEHEQLHFDIAEWYARLIRSSLLKYKNTEYALVKLELENCVKDMLEVHWGVQSLYDKNVQASEGQQAYWNKKVKIALDSLSGFQRIAF